MNNTDKIKALEGGMDRSKRAHANLPGRRSIVRRQKLAQSLLRYVRIERMWDKARAV